MGHPRVHGQRRHIPYLCRGHVRLAGFFDGAILTDPQGRIEGTGKKMRHLKARAIEDMDIEQLESSVKEVVALDETAAL